MNISKIKNLVKQNGDKFVLIENGEPEIVMMSFQEYERLAGGNVHDRSRGRISAVPEYAPVVASFSNSREQETEFEPSEAFGSAGLPVRLEDIRLEDLPL